MRRLAVPVASRARPARHTTWSARRPTPACGSSPRAATSRPWAGGRRRRGESSSPEPQKSSGLAAQMSRWWQSSWLMQLWRELRGAHREVAASTLSSGPSTRAAPRSTGCASPRCHGRTMAPTRRTKVWPNCSRPRTFWSTSSLHAATAPAAPCAPCSRVCSRTSWPEPHRWLCSRCSRFSIAGPLARCTTATPSARRLRVSWMPSTARRCCGGLAPRLPSCEGSLGQMHLGERRCGVCGSSCNRAVASVGFSMCLLGKLPRTNEEEASLEACTIGSSSTSRSRGVQRNIWGEDTQAERPPRRAC
mmetsp:Transcript_88200/g.238875  ORF Transcript_88200/g.238875 Transcript_88200/m.238875 type:complete len:305 (-) Transcript_88200:940-1854(-)